MELIPYNIIENQNIDTIELKITQDIFKNVEFITTKNEFRFENCRIKKLVIINKAKIDFQEISFCFSYCYFEDIYVESIVSEQISIHFSNCFIKYGNINNNVIKTISFNNCITQNLFLQNQQQIVISYTEENIWILKWIRLLNIFNIASVNNLINIKQSINIYHSKKIIVYFNHNKKEKYGVIRSPQEQIVDYRIRYNLTKKDKKDLDINLSINFSKEKDELLKIENGILNTLFMNGTANGKISIENTKINNIFIRDFSSESEMLLYNISPYLDESKVEIHKSNMDNCSFDNIDFNSYKLISFYRSRLSKSTFYSCNFPSDSLSFEKFMTLENIHDKDILPQNYYKDQYETFLQLKKSLEGTGNYYEAQKLSAISKMALNKVSNLPISDKLILCLSNFSNKHGLSIGRPFFLLLVFSIIFYILYLYSIDRIIMSSNIDCSLVGHYFTFLDITHKSDFLIPKSEFTFFPLALDFVNKIIVGFFSFQFISAFRKYVNK